MGGTGGLSTFKLKMQKSAKVKGFQEEAYFYTLIFLNMDRVGKDIFLLVLAIKSDVQVCVKEARTFTQKPRKQIMKLKMGEQAETTDLASILVQF